MRLGDEDVVEVISRLGRGVDWVFSWFTGLGFGGLVEDDEVDKADWAETSDLVSDLVVSPGFVEGFSNLPSFASRCWRIYKKKETLAFKSH